MATRYSTRRRARDRGEIREMNEQQLNQVLENVEEATVFEPGESTQLVPVTKNGDKIVSDAATLAADLIAVYQQLEAQSTAKLAEARKVAEIITSHATKMAEEANAMSERNQKIGKGVMKILDEHGIKFDGEL